MAASELSKLKKFSEFIGAAGGSARLFAVLAGWCAASGRSRMRIDRVLHELGNQGSGGSRECQCSRMSAILPIAFRDEEDATLREIGITMAARSIAGLFEHVA